ncbi:hypothetical protein [Falsiroseomonas sp.]|uniref:hypothetical protein n=1 Tax=Falsiroseomonas sp. TaxID=2870721 RepID=UPI0035680A0E
MPVTIEDVTLETVEAPPSAPEPTPPQRQPPPDIEAIMVALRRELSRRERLWTD